MITIKKISLFAVALCVTLTSCSDFFDPSTDDELNGEDYISSSTEMYTGFLGIMTKLQAIGDKEILLTETRGELIEPTDNSSTELRQLYNYEPTLQGNSYANPDGYYEVIIACNDYLSKMAQYRSNPAVTEEAYRPLVASTLRIKVWAYKTLAEIYGQAVWFDDPITKVTEIVNGPRFQLMPLEQLINKCLTTLETGSDGSAANSNIDWIAWLDPSKVGDIANSSYRKWNYMIPPYAGLHAELSLWKGALLDAAQQDAQAVYKTAADELLVALNQEIDRTSDPGSSVYWLPSGATPGHYAPIWNYAQPYPYESVAALIYDYTKNQTNTLLKHFSNEYPNKFLLRPSEVGMSRFTDATFNPGNMGISDTRFKTCFGQSSGSYYLAKFRPVGSTVRVNAYQDDCHIYLYRATQYHMMLAEALNHLRRFKAFNGVFNSGVLAADFIPHYDAEGVEQAGWEEWEGFASKYDPSKCDWTSAASFGTRRYRSEGVRCCITGLSARPVKGADDVAISGAAAVIRYNDLAILDECMLEFAGEGKVYPLMNRMAVRYGDLSIVADRVCPKYEAVGRAAEIRGKILSGGNWVPYNLGIQ
jgi:hypothetical protein